MRFNPVVSVVYALSAATFLASCGQIRSKSKDNESSAEPFASNVETKSETSKAEEVKAAASSEKAAEILTPKANQTDAAKAVVGDVTLKKSAIMGRTFLYGFDLQYSAVGDVSFSLLDQSQALGHIPVSFRIVGRRLQLLADNTRKFESVVNHPETLVNEYEIIAESDDELTITMSKPGMLLHKTFNGSDAAAPASSWLRSIEIVDGGRYLLQESALMNAKGEVQTFLESLMPRDALVPADYKPMEANRDTNDLATRYMLLDSEKVFVQRTTTNGVPVREETSFASRFNLTSETSTIDWYVTANAPDELMGELKSGVVGWNRYFKPQLGRDVMRFMGRLPAGVKLGDPRYNIINFDSVAEAGAAYESQASDPLTGIQSHSIVYMPYAWYNIAAKLSTARENPSVRSEESRATQKTLDASGLFGKDHRVLSCVRYAEEALEAMTPGEAVDDFGRRIFISTLFHEVGHALGLGHNFKGSLAYDGAAPVSFPQNATTYSVMDYNYYQHETDLVPVIGEAGGPVLEYDRQIISQLYNNGNDVAASDLVVPACNDADADSKDGGVDPNCIRYDAEKNPVVGLEHAWGRLANETGAMGIETKTLTERVNGQRERLLALLNDEGKTPDAASATALVTKFNAGLKQLVAYYITSGAQSVRTNLNLNAVALRAWRVEQDQLSGAITEADRRARYLTVLKNALSLKALPEAPQKSIEDLSTLVQAIVLQNDRFGSQDDRQTLADKLKSSILAAAKSSTDASLAKLRTTLADKLGFDKDLSFASGVVEGRTVESQAVGLLTQLVVQDLTAESLGAAASSPARAGAAKALATYKDLGDDYAAEIAAVKAQLNVISKAARDQGKQDVRDHIRALLETLH
jgi:hypothetical protein